MIPRGYLIIISIIAMLATGCAGNSAKKVVKEQLASGYSVINSVEVLDGSVQLQIDGPFETNYAIYKPGDPYTVVVEIPNVTIGNLPPKIVSEKRGVSEINFSMIQTPSQYTRMELLLDSPLTVEPKKFGNYLVLKIVDPAAPPTTDASAADMGLPAGMQLEVEKEANAPAFNIDDLMVNGEFRKAERVTQMEFSATDRSVRFTIYGDGIMEPDIFTLSGRIIVDIPSVKMKAVIPDTTYAPVKAVRYGTHEDKVRIVLDMEGDRDFLASTEDNTIIVTIPTDIIDTALVEKGKSKASQVAVAAASAKEAAREAAKEAARAGKPEAEADMAAAEEAEMEAVAEEEAAPATEEEKALAKKYRGSRISLDFQDASVVPIFRFLGDIGGYNVVIHPSVNGKITLKLLDVPWDQALDIILELSNLDKSFEGNILRVAPPDIFVKQKEDEAKLKASRSKAAELVQVAIHLQHISAAEMKARIDEAKLLSPRGTLRIDERTNTIILNDTAESIARIRDEEISYWDSAVHGTMQVLIEAKIVSVSSQYTHSLGISWGGSATDENFSFITDDSSIDFSVNTPVSSAGTATSATGAIVSIGWAETFEIGLSLSALETVSKARSLANPRVITIDKQAASISQGTSIPYSTQAEGGGTTITTQNANLALNVTPEIQPNGIIKLNVNVTNNKPVQIPGASAPGMDTQAVNTNALVKDGETLVLGGIFTNTEDEAETRVPLLHNLPVIGWLFKQKSVSKIPNELMIFITPRIIK